MRRPPMPRMPQKPASTITRVASGGVIPEIGEAAFIRQHFVEVDVGLAALGGDEAAVLGQAARAWVANMWMSPPLEMKPLGMAL